MKIEGITIPEPSPEEAAAMVTIRKNLSDYKFVADELCRAARQGQVWLMEQIYQSDYKNMNGHAKKFFGHNLTPIEQAAQVGKIDSVRFLLARGAEVRHQAFCTTKLLSGSCHPAREFHNDTYYIQSVHKGALHFALEGGYKDIARLLAQNGAYIQDDDFLKTIRSGDRELALDLRQAFSIRGEFADWFKIEIRLAADQGGLDAEELIRAPAPPVLPKTKIKEEAPSPVAVVTPPAAPPLPPDPWVKMGDDAVVHFVVHDRIGKKITDIFNFATRERSYIVENINVPGLHCVKEAFDDIRNKSLLEAACDAFIRQGGTLDKNDVMVLRSMPRKKEILPQDIGGFK